MDNTISPAMQKKLQEIAELQNILTNKLNEFAKLNENPKEIEEESLILRTELEEIKQISSTDSEETDREIEEKLKVVNERIERIAKAAIKAQEEVLIRTVDVLKEIRGTIYKLCLKVEALELADDMKKVIKDASLNFLATVEKRNQELDLYLREMKEMMVERKENNLSKCTKSSLQTKIANILHKIEYAYEMKRNQESDQVTTDAI
ncbi:uncharacterized protein LOC106670106 isoform X11 [Cimex lectularius]|uniref:Uncharacterized protein n=1 Tax=Cimex lectularius TaxID=79782 RepID=A0A8I6S3U1_CIMLE|nr:uncharacterized protein LOC106670106 isoform X11 [Cimex lectularius]